jgi:hypothetical protein
MLYQHYSDVKQMLNRLAARITDDIDRRCVTGRRSPWLSKTDTYILRDGYHERVSGFNAERIETTSTLLQFCNLSLPDFSNLRDLIIDRTVPQDSKSSHTLI